MSNRTRPTSSGGSATPSDAGSDGGLPIWIPLAIVGAVVAAIVIALVATSGDDGDDVEAGGGSGGGDLDVAYGEVEVVGEPLSPFSDAASDTSVGAMMPAITGIDPGGTTQVFANGRPRAVMLAAHWCPACQSEIDDINAYLDGGGEFPSGVDIQVIATWTDPLRANYPPGEWLAGNGWSYPTIVDDEDTTLANTLGLTGTPMWIFVSPDGLVVERTGSISAEDIAARLEVLAGA
jgi:hypothetical protein